MQPGSQPEDIHVILSRFHTWAGKNPRNGGKSVAPEAGTVREIPYEEAMRNYRQRQKTQTRRPAGSAAPPVAAARSASSETVPANPGPSLPVATDPLADAVVLSSSAEAPAEPAGLVVSPPAFVAKVAPALQSSEKKAARRKPAGPTKKASTQAVIPAALPAKSKPARTVQPKAPVQCKAVECKPVQCKPEPRRAVLVKKVAAPVRQRAAKSKKPAFKKVLAETVGKARAVAPAQRRSASTTRKSSPPRDRNRRVTTRFSATEQRQLERAASEAGLTVSAWLRQCALRAKTAATPRVASEPPIKKTQAAGSARPSGSTLFSTPAPSGLGSWLSLLRQRFLSSPARLSEQA
ncbi:MAG: hypothetical protein WBW84_20070 [Acidobacteriaceae bacterium]